MASQSSSHKKPLKYRLSSSLNSSINSLSSSVSTSTIVLNSERSRQYPQGHPGPYIIQIRSDRQKLNYSYVSDYLLQSRTGIKSCVKLTQDLCEVECRTIALAHGIMNDRNLAKYSVYVPARQVEVDGIIYFPTINNATDLLCGDSYGLHVSSGNHIKIVDASRINSKRVQCVDSTTGRTTWAPSHLVKEAFGNKQTTPTTQKTEKTTLIPVSPENSFLVATPLVKVTFAGRQLPNYIIMDDLGLDYNSQARQAWVFCGSCRTVQIPVRPYIRNANQAKSNAGNKITTSGKVSDCLICIKEITTKMTKGRVVTQNTQKNNTTSKMKSVRNEFRALTVTECP